MLTKVARVKNLGVFHDYSWDNLLPNLERYNVVYGDNGSGKTTLSRLLDCIKAGNHAEYPNLEYRIESQSGEIINGRPAARKIRVFNADYIELNIGPMDKALKPILVIGEENKAVAEQLAAEQAEIAERNRLIDVARSSIETFRNARGKVFTAIAKVISEATSGTAARTYRKNNAEAAFDKLTADTVLSADGLEVRRSTIRQEVMNEVSSFKPLMLWVNGNALPVGEGLQRALDEASATCRRSAVTTSIQRLREHREIAEWVEDGFHLHKAGDHADCEFCGQGIPSDRWSQLEAHFSTEDQRLKKDVLASKQAIEAICGELKSPRLPSRLEFYADYRDRFDQLEEDWRRALDEVQTQLGHAIGGLDTKLASRNEAVILDTAVDLTPLQKAYAAISGLVDEQNARTRGFDKACKIARDEIENHHLSSVKTEVAEIDHKIAEQESLIERETNGSEQEGKSSLASLHESTAAKRTQISNAHKAGERLTNLLHTFLGRSELVFHSSDEGYRVHRSGRPAKRLSEGERTAIAFIYFIVQLDDRDFDKAQGIVVIDDPVSSLDASSVYQAFSFLKNAVKDAKQVIILTHSYSFLRLVLNWTDNIKNSEGKKSYYMLICKSDASSRATTITALDKALIEHPTEYHFLFKVLVKFESDGTIAGCYHIPNVVRKVLETFLDFYAPAQKSLHAKLNSITFNESKKTAIYKFSNDLSHRTGQGFEPGLVQESQKNAAYLLEMIKDTAPAHYEGMMASVS